MRKSKFTPEQILQALRQAESGPRSRFGVNESSQIVCRFAGSLQLACSALSSLASSDGLAPNALRASPTACP
jgi:hypothetical protein